MQSRQDSNEHKITSYNVTFLLFIDNWNATIQEGGNLLLSTDEKEGKCVEQINN